MLFDKVMRTEGFPVAHADTPHYDFVLTNAHGDRLTFEIKTKKTTAAPRADYANSVCAHNATQDADFYVFLRLLGNRDSAAGGGTAYFCGALPCKEFRARARKICKGELEGNNGFRALWC